MTPVTATATVTGTGIETATETETAIGTGTGTVSAIEIVIGTVIGTATEAGTATETVTGPETAHHAGTVETAARVGAVSSGTDPRTKSNGNKPRAQDLDLRALRLAAFPMLGHIPLRWTGRTASKMWYSKSPPGLSLCGSPWLLATVDEGYYKICSGLLVCYPVFSSRPEELPLTTTHRIILMCISRVLLLSPWQ